MVHTDLLVYKMIRLKFLLIYIHIINHNLYKSFKADLFFGQKRSIRVVYSIVLRSIEVHLVVEGHISCKFYYLNADENELVTVFSMNAKIGDQHNQRHRCDVQPS